jgi:hypothetical protein
LSSTRIGQVQIQFRFYFATPGVYLFYGRKRSGRLIAAGKLATVTVQRLTPPRYGGATMKTTMICLLAFLAALPCRSESLGGAEGRKVRVWAPHRVYGTLAAFDHDTITVEMERSKERQVLPRKEIQKFEVRRSNKLRVGLIFAGAGTGLVAGLVAGLASDCAATVYAVPDDCQPATGGHYAAWAAGGTALGAAITALVTRELWANVDYGHVAVGVIPTALGAQMRLALRF